MSHSRVRLSRSARPPPAETLRRLESYTFGGAHDVIQSRLWQLAVGADLTFYTKPPALDSAYGKNPVSFQVFLRVRPALSHHDH